MNERIDGAIHGYYHGALTIKELWEVIRIEMGKDFNEEYAEWYINDSTIYMNRREA